MKIVNLGYLLLIIGIIWTGYKYTNDRKEIIIEKNKIEYTIQKQIGHLTKENVDTYNMILSIPQIGLKKGIYEKKDKRNNIEENIQIHINSDYPNKQISNVILMSYSGTRKKAIFKDIEELNQDSLIELYYDKTKYVYKIDNYYDVDKKSIASIKGNYSKKAITLIACNKKDKSKQLIYIGYLIDEIKY